MPSHRTVSLAVLALVLMVAAIACSSGGPVALREPAAEGIEPARESDGPGQTVPIEPATAQEPGDAQDRATERAAGPAWRTMPLEDVRTGESFRISDLADKVVAIEPMAIWCSNCRLQQREAVAAIASVGSDDLVYIGLDVDPNERARDLARYSAAEGFDWPFVVASRKLARSLAESFGDQVLSPPSTPLILVGRDGEVIDVHFGIRRADELAAVFEEHLAAA